MAGAPGQMGTAQSPAQMIQQNLALRAALLQSAPRMRKNLGSFSGGALGGTTRIKLFNVGITTKIVIDVIATIDIGTAVATASTKAPFNLINRIKLTDFDGTDRINCSGYQMWVLQSVRNQTPVGYNNESQTAVLTSPLVPTSVATSQTLRFQLEIPLAYNPTNDLRGALLTQTAVGEAWLNLDWNTVLYTNANEDAVYSGGATTTVILSSGTSIIVNVFQEYLLPQSIGGQVPLPALDLMTVYEVSGALRSSDNIANGAEKLFNYPNVRSVIGAYFNFINNGAFNPATTDLSRFRLIANGNNVLREYLPTDKLFDQRRWLIADGDLRKGTYFETHREKPIETALFGNVQYGITPASVSGTNTNFEVCFESFYTKGSMLPGLSQSSG
jgi:hypothetical protein